MSAPNCAPLNLTIFITCINRLKFSKNSTNNQLKGSKFSIFHLKITPQLMAQPVHILNWYIDRIHLCLRARFGSY